MKRDVIYFDREIAKLEEEIKHEELGEGCVAVGLAIVVGSICGAIPIFLLPGVGVVIGIVVFILFMVAFAFNVMRGQKRIEKLKQQIAELEQGKQATVMYNAKLDVREGQEHEVSSESQPTPTGLFSVRIVGLPDDRQQAIDLLQEELSIDVAKAVILVDKLPSIALEGVSHDAAEMTARRLRKRGMLIEVVRA